MPRFPPSRSKTFLLVNHGLGTLRDAVAEAKNQGFQAAILQGQELRAHPDLSTCRHQPRPSGSGWNQPHLLNLTLPLDDAVSPAYWS